MQSQELSIRLDDLRKAITPRLSPYNPKQTTPKQNAFLCLNHVEDLFYGGAAGGGKSVSLLMGALQYVDVPQYAALLLRRTYPDLSQPGALMDMAHQWLDGTDAIWNGNEHRWYFPSGATLTFGYLNHYRDKYRYQGAEYQYCGFDEATQFHEEDFKYLFSRLRKNTSMPDWLPIRMRAASNPGDIGHEWVKRHYINPKTREPGSVFLPANIEDNPYLKLQEYEKMLARLDPVERARLRRGDWDIVEEGELFKRRWFRRVDREAVPADARMIRYWDLAATKSYQRGDPDYTVGVLMAEKGGQFWIVDVIRFRGSPGEVETEVLTSAEWDGDDVPIHIEQEGGASGKIVAHHYRTNVLPGFSVKFIPSRQDKASRAKPLSSASEAGNVTLVRARWNEPYLDELTVFPSTGYHDDQVDASSGAHIYLSKQRRKIMVGTSSRTPNARSAA